MKPHNPYGTTATAAAAPPQPGGGSPHPQGIPMAIPVGYAHPATYATTQHPGTAGMPPAMLVSPGGGFAGPYSGMGGSPVMTNVIIHQPPEIAPVAFSPETEVVVNRYRSRLQCIATAMCVVGIAGIIPTATWVTCFLAAVGGFIALSTFKDTAQLARIAGGYPSRCASPIHAYNLAIAVVVLAPLNFLFCILQTAARRGTLSGPSSTGGSRFDSVTYILGIPWSIVLLGLGAAFIANYNKLAAAVRSVHLGNTCCCGPARDVSWVGYGALAAREGSGAAPGAGNHLIILAPAGSMVPPPHGITGGGTGGGGVQMVAISPAGHGGGGAVQPQMQQPMPAGAYFVGPQQHPQQQQPASAAAAFPDGPPPAHVLQAAGQWQPPRAL